MSLNIKVAVAVDRAFHGAVATRTVNNIALGDRLSRSVESRTTSQGERATVASLAPELAPDVLPPRASDPVYRGERVPRRVPPSGLRRTSDYAATPAATTMPRTATNDTDAAIRSAATVAGVDVNTMRAIASVESGMNPASNRHARTQYKGLYQLGREEWARHGRGDIYNAGDNAAATARMFTDHRARFRGVYGREPTDRELYMIHQQGLGFYTRGAMTNIGGNPYPGMRGPQTHASFEAGWGREIERRRAAFQNHYGPAAAAAAGPTAAVGGQGGEQ